MYPAQKFTVTTGRKRSAESAIEGLVPEGSVVDHIDTDYTSDGVSVIYTYDVILPPDTPPFWIPDAAPQSP